MNFERGRITGRRATFVSKARFGAKKRRKQSFRCTKTKREFRSISQSNHLKGGKGDEKEKKKEN